ncbi:hypothetical protein C8A03DRAFT_38440 [Achaetomium macrosporum]|uniref:Uncharacterized protein n=1 Tax=Achaetomium macrosporum TaxID=79813 RepID=A0AAN7C1W2_9PEZI|nr:hypothetical protein C8A03DRAFT_38440 [Achaetomium macrosporum]
MSTHLQSSGRGGAGNIIDSSKSPPLQPEDLQTPTLKTSKVTTGRGGTGNFASGLDAEEKRRRQDVEPVVRRMSHGATHIGRGGTGNVVKTGPADDKIPSPAGSPALSPVPAAALEKVPSRTDKERKEKEKEKEKRSSPAGSDTASDVAVPARKPEEIGWAEKGRNLLFGKK